MWKTYVQGLLDYSSQVWCPVDIKLISHLDTTQRMYTVQTDGLQHLIYWERLSEMKLYFSSKMLRKILGNLSLENFERFSSKFWY